MRDTIRDFIVARTRQSRRTHIRLHLLHSVCLKWSIEHSRRFVEVDALENELKRHGFHVQATPDGPVVKKLCLIPRSAPDNPLPPKRENAAEAMRRIAELIHAR